MSKKLIPSLKLSCLVGLTCLAVQVSQAQVTTGLTFWLDAGSGVSVDGSGILTWASSVGGLSVTAADAAASPTRDLSVLEINNKPAIRFDGQNNGLASTPVAGSALVSADQGALFMVFQPDVTLTSGPDSGQTPFGWFSNSGANRLAVQTDWVTQHNTAFQFGNPSSGGQVLGPQLTFGANNWYILSLVRNADGSASMRVGGVDQTINPTSFSSTFDVNLSAPIQVGGSVQTSDNFHGAIAELLTYNTVTPGLAADVETYLGTKYGLAPVPEPSEYATVFGLICVAGALVMRHRRQQMSAV